MKLVSGDRISWQYIHHLNSRSSVEKIKYGVYFGKVKHTVHWLGKSLAIVQFDGNKRVSRIPIAELKLYTV
jgi:hypothetical protein